MSAGRHFGALKVRAHSGPQAFIGNSTEGWGSVQVVEPWNNPAPPGGFVAEIFTCGLIACKNDNLLLCYNINGFYAGETFRFSTSMGVLNEWRDGSGVDGFGPIGQTGGATVSLIGSCFSATGLGQEQTWIAVLNTFGAANDLQFLQDRGNGGLTWPVNVIPVPHTDAHPPQSTLCGGAWLNNQYGLLYSEFSTNKVFYLSTTNPAVWPVGTQIDTMFTGRVCGMKAHPSGVLVGLLQDVGTLAVSVIISNDTGATWRQVTIEALFPVPFCLLTCIGHVLYIVYLIGDVPRFVASENAGDDWTYNTVTTDGSTSISAGGQTVVVA